MFKMSNVKSKDLLMIINDNTVTMHPVVKKDAEIIECADAVVQNANEVKSYLNTTNGSIVYVANLDVPAKIEAENLKRLRRSTALKQVFNFERGSNNLDLMKMLPYIIIILMVLF